MAVYGRPRATIDIDLLVLPENVDAIVHLAGSLGFVGEDELRGLGGGQLVITRMIRVVPPVEDFVILDLIHATGPLLAVYEQRQNFTLPGGYLWVLSRAALIEMKLRRNSKQDMADIEVLQEDKDES